MPSPEYIDWPHKKLHTFLFYPVGYKERLGMCLGVWLH